MRAFVTILGDVLRPAKCAILGRLRGIAKRVAGIVEHLDRVECLTEHTRAARSLARFRWDVVKIKFLARVEMLEPRIAPATFIVTTTDDSGAGSLRKAILDANAMPGFDTITFNIDPPGQKLINVLSALPQITDQVSITGSSQPGTPPNTPGIQIDGADAGDANGLDVIAGGSTIEGLVITHFERRGVFIHEVGLNTIDNCCIGIDHNGEVAAPNLLGGVAIVDVGANIVKNSITSGNGKFGILITGDGATFNTVQSVFVGVDVSGTKAVPNTGAGVIIEDGAKFNQVDLCTVSGNDLDGVQILGIGTNENEVTRSKIGTNFQGSAAVPNKLNGVVIDDGSKNIVGGTGQSDSGGNLISGNKLAGVEVTGEDAKGNRVLSNIIGLNFAGNAKVPNEKGGVQINGAPETVVGSPVLTDRNVISGNMGDGVAILGGFSANAKVQGNYIGTDAAGSRPGTSSLGNTGNGITINGAPEAIIGGGNVGEGNVISDNGKDGITVLGGLSKGAVIAGNRIGTDVTGKLRLGNVGDGVAVLAAADITIGGSSQAEGNLISGNQHNGILLAGKTTERVSILQNRIGTDINGTAKLRNDLNGILIDGAPNNLIGDEHAGGNIISGNGLTFVDGDGIQIKGATAKGNKIFANLIGTNTDGDAKLANAGSGIRVIDAPGNFIGGIEQDRGNVISGNDGDGITITGRTAASTLIAGNAIGVSENRQALLANAFDGVFIDGAPKTRVGSILAATQNVVSGNDGHGIHIKGASAGSTTIVNNIIGLGGDGMKALGNGGDGVLVDGAPKTNIGGAAPNAANVISDNTANGVEVKGGTAAKTIIAKNIIGLGGDGLAKRGNHANGVVIDGAAKTRVGGPLAGLGNVISANALNGVLIQGAGVKGTLVVGNLVGLDGAGAVGRGNQLDGVVLDNVSGVVVGGARPTEQNVIADHVIGAGVTIDDGDSNKVLGNFIGTDKTGKVGIGNFDGVVLKNGTFNNDIGGTNRGEGNLIAANGAGAGVFITDANTMLNEVAGNVIGLDAAGLKLANGRGVLIALGASENIIGGRRAGAGNLIGGNTNDGVLVTGAGTDENEVFGNIIGTDRLGTPGLGNGGDGVEIAAGAKMNVIGGRRAGERNTISANGGDGVAITGNSSANEILGNMIGAAAGVNGLGNVNGVSITASPGNFIGGRAGGEGNVITGNGSDGVVITGAASTNNRIDTNLISGNTANGVQIAAGANANNVVGNRIGTNAGGNAAQANNNGVVIIGANGNFIGGAAAGDANVISGNATVGVAIAGGAAGNTVDGNLIGTDATGKGGVPNGDAGVSIINAPSNVIGLPAAPNVISGNLADGVFIGGAAATLNSISSNFIGTKRGGSGALGNMGDGVAISDAGGNTIGGPGIGNVIANNKLVGVSVKVGIGAANGNRIQENSIFENGGLGIDLGDDGVTPNDPDANDDADTGANGLQNFPIVSALADGKGADVSVFLQSAPNSRYIIELFLNTASDPTGFGEGKVFAPPAASIVTDGFGRGVVNLIGVPAKLGGILTATATDVTDGITFNTSEFSKAVEVGRGAPRVADSTLVLTGDEVSSVVLSFLGGLKPGAATKVGNYSLTGLGPDGEFGSGDDVEIEIKTAKYDKRHNTVTLTPKVAPDAAEFLRITASDSLTDPSGEKLDGEFNGHFPSGDGIAGGQFVMSEIRTASFAYKDANGDGVTLALTGGGLLELVRSASGEGELLRIIDAVAGVTALGGNVVQAGSGDGATTLNAITGLDGVPNNLLPAKFIITG
jgi:hypothetical protein